MKRTVAASGRAAELAAQIPLLDADLLAPNGSSRRSLGAYYTPRSAADYMADWVVRYDGERVLEPSFGDGIFLRAIATSARGRNFTKVYLSGVEIDEKARAQLLHERLTLDFDMHCQD